MFYPGNGVLTQLARFAVYTMSLEFSANILSRFKQGHEFKNVFPLGCLLVSLSGSTGCI